LVAIGGSDGRLPNYRDKNNDARDGHKWLSVHQHITLVVAREYPGAGNVRTMGRGMLLMFYAALRGELHSRTKPAPKG
jgi:hypothetical protein